MNTEPSNKNVLIVSQQFDKRIKLFSRSSINNDMLYIMFNCIFDDTGRLSLLRVVQQVRMGIDVGIGKGVLLITLHIYQPEKGMMLEMSDRQMSYDTNIMKKANLFIQELDEFPKKYQEADHAQFIQEFRQLNDHERYTCAQIILSNAWGHINADKKHKARADIAFIIPLCVERDRKQLYYPEFEIDRMIWESWINDEDISQQKKESYSTLMNQCGFKFENFVRKKPKPVKTGFQKFLDKIRCKCCGRAG